MKTHARLRKAVMSVHAHGRRHPRHFLLHPPVVSDQCACPGDCRELAQQIAEQFTAFGARNNTRVQLIVGGLGESGQETGPGLNYRHFVVVTLLRPELLTFI
jgi:hypothetical protein